MKYMIFIFVLFLTLAAKAETIIIPVQDLLFDVPNFKAPTKGFNSVLDNQNFIDDVSKPNKNNKIQKRKLINMVHELYPEAESIHIWNGSFIIKLPEN